MRGDLPTEILSCEIIKTERDTAMSKRFFLVKIQMKKNDGKYFSLRMRAEDKQTILDMLENSAYAISVEELQ